jgi:hypothetical protein
VLRVITIRKPWGYEQLLEIDGAVVRADDLVLSLHEDEAEPAPKYLPMPDPPKETIEFLERLYSTTERVSAASVSSNGNT